MAEDKKVKVSQLDKLETLGGGESLLGVADGKGYQIEVDTLKEYIGSGGGGNVDFKKVASDIVPLYDEYYSLGNAEKAWRSLHVSDAINLGRGIISARLGTDLPELFSIDVPVEIPSKVGYQSRVMTELDVADEYAKKTDIPKDCATNSSVDQKITNLKGGASTEYDTLKKLEGKIKANTEAIANKPSETYTFGDGLKEESGKVTVKIEPLPELQFGSGLYPLHFGENGGLTIKLGDGLSWGSNGEIINTREAVSSVEVVDNLTSTSSTKALSAKQGKVLKGLIDSVDTTASNAQSTADSALSKAKANEASIAALGVNNTTLANKINEVDGVAKQNKTDIATLNGTTKTLQGSVSTLNVQMGSALSDIDKLITFYEGTDTDSIINKWVELETVLKGLTESDNLAEILSGKADKSTVYTITEVDTMLGSYAKASSVTELTNAVQMVQLDLLSKIGAKADQSYVDSNFVNNDRASDFAEYGQFLNINNGIITINGVSIKPLTSYQTLYSLTLKDSSGNQIFAYDPKTAISGGYIYQLTKSMVGLGNVENTKLSTWGGSTNITKLGTITSGTWNGTKIGQSYLDLSGYAKSSDLDSYLKKTSLSFGTGLNNDNFSVAVNTDVIATKSWVEGKNYLTSVSKAQVTTALGFTPQQIISAGDGIAFSSNVVSVDSTIARTSALANYLPLSGGTLSRDGRDVLSLNSNNGYGPTLKLFVKNVLVGTIGHIPNAEHGGHANYGIYLSNKDGNVSLMLGNDGGVYISKDTQNLTKDYTIIHSGNIGSQNVASATKLKGQSAGGAVDANTLFNDEQSVRYRNGISNESTNIPVANSWQNSILELGLHGNGTTAQLYFSKGAPLYYRANVNESWRKVLDDINLGDVASDGLAFTSNLLSVDTDWMNDRYFNLYGDAMDSTTDANTVPFGYHTSTANTKHTNAPESNCSILCVKLLNDNNNYKAQLALGYNSDGGGLFYRNQYWHSSGNKWTDWRQVMFKDNSVVLDYDIDPTITSLNRFGYGFSKKGWGTSGPTIAAGSKSGYTMLLQQGAGNNTLIVNHKNADGSMGDWKTVAFTDSTVAAANKIVDSSNNTLLHLASSFITAPEGLRIGNNNQYCGLFPNNKITSGGDEKDLYLYNQSKLRLYGATGIVLGVGSGSNIVISGNVGIGTAEPKCKLDVNGVMAVLNTRISNAEIRSIGTYAGASLYYGIREKEALSIEVVDSNGAWVRNGIKVMTNGDLKVSANILNSDGKYYVREDNIHQYLGDYLPLSGGTLTNSIILPDGVYIRREEDHYAMLGYAPDKKGVVVGTPNTVAILRGTNLVYNSNTVIHDGNLSAYLGTGLMWASSGAIALDFTESDPVFTASAAYSITNTNKSNWNTAYSNWTNGVSSLKVNKLICKSDSSIALSMGSIEIGSGIGSGYSFYADSAAYIYLGAENYSWYGVYAYSYNNVSDATKKNVLGNVELKVNDIANAPAKVFTWKDLPDKRRKVGTIAQYWQNVLSEVVSGSEGSLSMNYAELAVVSSIVIARSVETHAQRIERLEREIAEMQEELKILKDKGGE